MRPIRPTAQAHHGVKWLARSKKGAALATFPRALAPPDTPFQSMKPAAAAQLARK